MKTLFSSIRCTLFLSLFFAVAMLPAASASAQADAASEEAGCTDEAYAFALKIRDAVVARDLDALFALVDGELEVGPRKALVQGKSFSDVFPEEWRNEILAAEPLCWRNVPGWRGFVMAGGIWFWESTITSDGSIYRLYAGPEEPVGSEPWYNEDQLLGRECFETIWVSGDNYEEYHKQFGTEWESYEEFSSYPGRYLGGAVPLEPIVPGWSNTVQPKTISLARKLGDCEIHPETARRDTIADHGYMVEIEGDVRIEDGWVKEVDHCFERGDCYDNTYTSLRQIPLKHCGKLAPHFAGRCKELRLVQTADYTSGTMRVFGHFVIYGLVKNPTDGELYIMPLANAWNLNEALNVVDTLETEN